MYRFFQEVRDKENLAVENENTRAGYYAVHIRVRGLFTTYRVLAHSDYAAALQVRRLTGVMPASENDVKFLATPAAATLTKAFDMFAA